MSTGTPVALAIAKTLIRHRIRGGYRLLDAMIPRWKGTTVDYALSPEVRFTVPIGNPNTCWDAQDLKEYEASFITCFCSALAPMRSVTLVDCGASIGLFSASVCCRMNNIERVLAFEPNAAVHDVLSVNISRLPNGEAHLAAVGECCGFGRLERPRYDPTSDHARFVVSCDEGFPITTIDSFEISGDVALKVDVEGAELAVIRGAADTIRRAQQAVVAFEAHPKVSERTEIRPKDCMRFLQSLRPFRFTIAETNQQVMADSVLPGTITNIIAETC